MTNTRQSALSAFARSVDGGTYADGVCDTLVLLDMGLAILHFHDALVANELHAHVFLPPAELQGVDSDEQRLHAVHLCMLDIFPGDLLVPAHVPILPEISRCNCG